jgi:hypothetical protein
MAIHRDIQVYKTYGDSKLNKGKESFQSLAYSEDATPVVAARIPVAELEGVLVTVKGFAIRPDATESVRTFVYASYRRAAAGNVTATAAATAVAANDSSGTPTITLVANTTAQSVDVTVTGEAAKDFAWDLDIEVQRISF